MLETSITRINPDRSEWTNQIAVDYPTMQSSRILQSDCCVDPYDATAVSRLLTL